MKRIAKILLLALGFGSAVSCQPMDMYGSPETVYEDKEAVNQNIETQTENNDEEHS